MKKSGKKRSWVLVLLSALFFTMFLASAAQAGTLEIQYTYDWDYGLSGIAHTATAYFTEQDKEIKIGFARALEIVKKNPGPNHLLVEETHYNADGPVMYKGILEFRFAGSSAVLVREERISGKKRFGLFSHWPSGR